MPKQSPYGERTGVTLVYETGERDDDALERMRWVLPVVFLGAALVLFFAVTEWFRPHVPAAIFAVCVWVPLGAFLVWRMGVSKWRSVAAVMAVAASFCLPLLAWNVGLYRAGALTVVQELTPADLSLKAADDRSDRVAAIACEQMLASQELAKLQRAQSVLEARPEMAVQCLEGLEGDGRGAVVRMSRHLHVHWYDGWMSDETPIDDDVGCEAAHHYRDVGRMYGDESTPQLLSCALGADDEGFSRCCGEALDAVDKSRKKVEPEQWIHELEMPLFELLVDTVDVPARRLLADEAIVDVLPWAPRELFHWKTHLGCHLTEQTLHPEPVARQLSRTIETQCGLEIDDPLYSLAGVRFVERTCEKAVWTERQHRLVDVVQWCEAARTANRETAVESAKFVVHRASRAHEVDVLEEVITRGSALQRGLDSERSRFALDGRGRIGIVDDIGPDEVRLRRPEWTEHTPASQRRREAMEATHDERREEVRRRLDDDGRQRTSEELRREVEREAGQKIIDDIEELRQRGR